MMYMRYVGCYILYVGCYILYVLYVGDMWAVRASMYDVQALCGLLHPLYWLL